MSIRIGALAASRIADAAIIEPAREITGVEVVAVAARNLGRARQAADRWGVPTAYGSYRELIDDPEVDVVYIGTPASLHREWAIAAIEAGKHVLCEKPFAANAGDARRIAAAARESDVVVMEAFHWRYHPYADRIREVLDSGVLGDLQHVEAVFDLPPSVIPRDDIRWNLAIGGGATMDLGCYPIQWVRFATGEEPGVVSAAADVPVPGLDASLTAELRFPSGVTGRISSSMVADVEELTNSLTVTGSRGRMIAINPLAPQYRTTTLTIETPERTTTEPVDTSSTYHHQLVAFRDAILTGAPFPTTADDGVRNMMVVDDCYRAAGLEVRPSLD